MNAGIIAVESHKICSNCNNAYALINFFITNNNKIFVGSRPTSGEYEIIL